ncbi:hypothetical protein EYC56_03440 [Xanthomonas oryzae]|nr:hypothetical protein EYC54_20145 [Xanthomonas oryzae]QBG98650.1 hypothetical protein EYC56_03440 [Xanthomonas oryzae]QBH05091.1 hypothetical protein EYC57_19325 [Xanthomonas oryzae]
MSGRIKDRLLLLLTAFVASVLGWAFWHYVGEAAVWVWVGMLILSLVLLRKGGKREADEQPPDDTVSR